MLIKLNNYVSDKTEIWMFKNKNIIFDINIKLNGLIQNTYLKLSKRERKMLWYVLLEAEETEEFKLKIVEINNKFKDFGKYLMWIKTLKKSWEKNEILKLDKEQLVFLKFAIECFEREIERL